MKATTEKLGGLGGAEQQGWEMSMDLLQAMPCPALMLDPRGQVQHVNALFEALGGYRADEVRGRDWFSLFLPDAEQARQRTGLQSIVRGDAEPAQCSAFVTRGGDVLEVEWNDRVLRDAGGRALSVLRIDVGERRRVDEAVRLCTKRLNEAQRIARVGSWELDLLQGQLFWTDEIYRLFEIDKEKFGATYEAFLNAIHPDDRDAVNQAYTRSLADRRPYQIVHRLCMPDGRIKYVEERCWSDFDPQGRPVRSVGTVQDITVQQQTEQALRKSELFFRTVFDNASVGMMLTDGRRVLRMNQAYLDLLGFAAGELEELDAEAFRATTHPDDIERSNHAVQALLDGRKNHYRIELRHIRKGGEVIWALVSGTAIRDDDNRVNHLVVQALDITPQKRAEESVRRLNAELENRVAQRTAQLKSTNDELLQSLEQLNRAQAHLVQSEKMAALGGLVAGVAHEINTPLGIGITAVSHLNEKIKALGSRYQSSTLSRDDLTVFLSVANESAEMVLYNLGRAAELIRSFKQVAVDQSGGAQRRFHLKDYLQEVLRSLRPELDRTSHKTRLACPADLEIVGRPGDYSQIVTNLVMNSLAHGFEGISCGHIAIVVRRQGRDLILRYSDDGRGIDEAHLPKIFDPFYTTRRGQGGSGLGLHVVYNIVTQGMKGQITCASTPGHGVVFEIRVPLHVHDEVDTLPGRL